MTSCLRCDGPAADYTLECLSDLADRFAGTMTRVTRARQPGISGASDCFADGGIPGRRLRCRAV